MGLGRKTLLQILEESKDNQLDLTSLSKELDRRRVLGFGVEARDVVYALEKEGKVHYDRIKEIVYLPKPPLEVSDETLKKWEANAKIWAAETKKKIVEGDLPPGFDSDDEHKYTFKIPK